MDMISFKEEVLRLIAFRQEGEYWDFKKEWHKNKSDLLHDIICMAKYSLQGTTQGNGLTGADMPVRFSM